MKEELSNISQQEKKDICNWYSWGKSIENLATEHSISIELIGKILIEGGQLSEYKEDDKPKGQLMKGIDATVAYCPECGGMTYPGSHKDRRINPEGKEEQLCWCESCDCEFWAYEDYGIDEHRRKSIERKAQLEKMSKDELIKLVLAFEHLS